MIRSFATYARIHCPSEYDDYLNDKSYGYSGKKKRLKQVIKAEIMNGEKEYKFQDWLKEYDEYHEDYEWQGGWYCAKTY